MTRRFSPAITAVLSVAATVTLSACGLRGGGDEMAAVEVPLYCVGDPIPVGDHTMSIAGIGRSSTDLYLIENLILRTDDNEKVVIHIYEGAKLPPGSGTVAWHDHLLTVTENDVTPPKTGLAPCARVDVGPIPADYVPPDAEGDSGH